MNGWEQIVGHGWAVDLLQSAITHHRIGHAYLLTGPDQIGKTTLAQTFAQALNCTETDSRRRPCQSCRNCQLIAMGRHPDVRLIVPEVSGRGKATIKIETMRELQHDLSLANYEAVWKVAIVKRFDTATIGAANAFLKTLEEPPAKVVLILTALDSEGLLPTISSRCRTLALRPLPQARVADALRKRWDVDSALAYTLSHLADGRLGWAINMAHQPDDLEERRVALVQLASSLSGNLVARFHLADQLARQPEALPNLLQIWSTWWRDVAMLAWQSAEFRAVTNIDRLEELEAAALQLSHADINRSLRGTQEAVWQLAHNANARLVLENLFLGYPKLAA
jgi:DNA polymerase-3 subunit delta'